MLKIGQTFNINNEIFCVLDLISFVDRNFVFFSKEIDKIKYVLYEYICIDGKYNFIEVEDKELYFNLIEILERKMLNE